MMKLPITATMLKTKVSWGQVQVRDNPTLVMGDQTDGYWKVENTSPMMMVMKTKISKKATNLHQAAPTAPQ